jgi:hypothetical protein
MPPFVTPALSIEENGIDLLRNRFAYLHLDFSEIEHFRIEDGHLLKNRWIIFVAGIGLLAGAFMLFVPTLQIGMSILSESSHSFSFKGLGTILVFPLLLILFGGYCIFQSQLKSKILTLQTNSGQYRIRVREIDEAGYLRDLEAFLESKITRKAVYFHG